MYIIVYAHIYMHIIYIYIKYMCMHDNVYVLYACVHLYVNIYINLYMQRYGIMKAPPMFNQMAIMGLPAACSRSATNPYQSCKSGHQTHTACVVGASGVPG